MSQEDKIRDLHDEIDILKREIRDRDKLLGIRGQTHMVALLEKANELDDLHSKDQVLIQKLIAELRKHQTVTRHLTALVHVPKETLDKIHVQSEGTPP